MTKNVLAGLLGCGLLLFSDVSADNDTMCDYYYKGTPANSTDYTIPSPSEYNTELVKLNITAVFQDLYMTMLDSEDCWPADTLGGETSYAGLMLRLAWHCAGTFRDTDGEGGCAGGRIRYDPEASWMDNANLDQARALLAPIKEAHGDALRCVTIIYCHFCILYLYLCVC